MCLFEYKHDDVVKFVFLRLDPMLFRLCLLTSLLLVNPVQAKTVFFGLVSYISDGDTLWVQPDAGGRVKKLRIDGIDAPEICQSGGKASRDLLAQRALHQRVQVVVRRHDVYGRGLARIELNGRDLGEQMVQAGQAWSYRWRRDAGPYAAQEAVARQSRLGLFAESQAVLPRDFRKQHGSCYTPK